MRGSDLLVRCLESEGVERVFGIPGEENLDVMDSLIDSGIEFVTTRHEEGAALMAGVQGRLTGRPGVCLSTLGPGATNLITGVADAFLSYEPMVALTGQVWVERAYHPQKQFIDIVDVFRPITKSALSVRSPGRIPSLVRHAFATAGSERPGPVLLELPQDVMRAEAGGESLPAPERLVIRPAGESMQRLRDEILGAERPLALLGPGVIREGAQEEVRSFVRGWGIPSLHTWHANGIIPFDDPLSLHTVGLRTHDLMRAAFQEADLVMLVGYDLAEFQPVFWNIGREKRVAHLGPLPAETAPGYTPDLEVIGSISAIMHALSRPPRPRDNWAEGLRQRLHRMMGAISPEGDLVKPQQVVRSIRSQLGREDIAVCDVGAHLLWMMRLYPAYRENTLIASNGLIPMGFGVPAAIASSLCFPDRKVVAACGDGGFMMTSVELETAKRLGVGFVTVIFNDSGYGLIRARQEKGYGRTIGVELGNPDFVRYAESFGAAGFRVESAQELDEVMRRCLKEDILAVIDVPVDRAENARLTR